MIPNKKSVWLQYFKTYFSPISFTFMLFLIILLLSSILSVLRSTVLFFVSFFALGFAIMIIVKTREGELDLFELIMDSVFISLIVSVSTILMLAVFGLNNVKTYSMTQYVVLIMLSLFILKINVKCKIRRGKTELLPLLLSTVLISVFISVNISVDKFYTPDEYTYLKNSLDFIQYGYLSPIAYLPSRSFADILYGRFLWQATLASFIESTLGQLPYYALNLPFFVILLTSAFSLLRLLFGENTKISFIAWLIVCSNPLIFILSHFVLIDFAQTSLSLFGVYWFIKAFKSDADVNFRYLIKSFIILLISLLFKFNLVLPIGLWIIFVVFALKNRFYRLSKWHKFLFLIITTPVVAYELFFDIPALFTYYVLHNLQLNYLFARYVFFSPLGILVNFIFRTPWTYRTWFDIPNYEKLFFFFNILSPELMTPIVSSFALLSFLILKKKRDSRMLAGTSLLTLFIAFIGFLSSENYYDIQRDLLSVILLLQIVGLTSFFVSLNTKKHFLYASIALMQVITYFEYIVLTNKGITFYLWGAKLENTFDRLLLMNILLSILVFFMMISGAKLPIRFKISNSRSRFKLDTLILILLFSLLLANNINLTSYGLRNNTYFLNHEMSDLASQANNLEGKTLLMSNAYALPLYTLNTRNAIFISAPLTVEEFYSFLKAGIRSKIIISNDVIPTWISYRMGSNEYLQALPPIVTFEEKTSKALEPLFDGSKKILFHLRSINSSEIYTPLGNGLNMTTIGSPIWVSENQTRLMYFDGVNDYITVSGEPLFRPSQKLTVEVWFKTDKPQNGKFLVMGGYDNMTYLWGVYLSANSTAMSFYIKGQKIYNPIINGRYNDGFWHQFVGVFDGKNITVYLDGKSVKNMVLEEMVTITPSEDFKIYVGSWSGRNPFEGYIGFVNVYEDAFDPTVVMEQYIKAQGERAHILAKAVSVTQNYAVFDVYGKDIYTPLTPNVIVKNVNIKPVKVGDSFNHTSLSIDFYAKKSFNGTLILNTDYFSTFQRLEIKEGYNHVERTFPNTIDSKPIGIAIGQKTTILMLSDDGELLTNTVISLTMLKGIELSYVLIPTNLLIIFYIYYSSRTRDKQLKN